MPNKTTYYSDSLYGLLLQVSQKEHPEEPVADAVNKVIQDAVTDKAVDLAKKHKIRIPKKLKEGDKP
jgi:hypothetical protein